MRSGPRARSREPQRRGFILLLALLVTSVVSLAALSFQDSVGSQIGVRRDEGAALRAELAAQSGIEYARRRLFLDPAWDGTGTGDFSLDGATRFQVTRHPGPVSLVDPTEVALTVEGKSGGARFRLETTLLVTPGDALRTSVFAPLGGRLDVKYTAFHGDLVVVDQLGVVRDWDPAAGDWVEAGPSRIENISFGTSTLDGTLHKYTQTDYLGGATDEQVTSKPLHMPAWSLEDYLVPGPDRVTYDGVTSLTGVTLEQTAVFKLAANQNPHLDDCEFRGGVVVYVEPGYDLRSGPRNKIYLQHENSFGGGSGGVHPSIGLIAPGAQVTNLSGLGQFYHGFNFWNQAEQDNWLTLDGQLIVVNDVFHVMHADLSYDPEVAADPPPGIQYAGPLPAIDVLSERESYDPIQ